MALTAYEVTAPRRASGITGPARGSVRLVSDERGEETVEVPVAVARLLAQDDYGDVASVDEAFARIDAACRRSAAVRIVRLQEGRDHAEAEIAERLRGEGFEAEVIEDALAEARAKRIVSDLRFADAFVRAKVAAGWGAERIRRELAARRIDVSDLAGWPDEYVSADEEVERACAAASRKHVSGRDAYAKLVRFLLGRGFAMEVARTAARRTLDEAREDEDDWD